MKNLENLNLKELTVDEQINIDGGIIPVVAAIALAKGFGIGFAAVGAAVALYSAAKDAA